MSTEMPNNDQANELLGVINRYSKAFSLMRQFDNRDITIEGLSSNVTYVIEHSEAMRIIDVLNHELISRHEAHDLFGKQKDESLQGILGNIAQSFNDERLYPSVEEQAAHLLYFVIKDHPFIDGNKRIGAFLFIWFLELNRYCFKSTGEIKINDNALVALALLVAQSNPNDKELMIRLIINLLMED